jgi:hypothetical protein
MLLPIAFTTSKKETTRLLWTHGYLPTRALAAISESVKVSALMVASPNMSRQEHQSATDTAYLQW